MADDPLTDALRRHHDDRVPVITRAEMEVGSYGTAGSDRRRPSRRNLLVAAAAIVALLAGGLIVHTLIGDSGNDVTAGPGDEPRYLVRGDGCAGLGGLADAGLLRPGHRALDRR